MIDPPTLGVMLRAHVRHDTLNIALSELFRYQDELGLTVKVHLLADRPNWLVEQVIERWRGRLWGMRYSPFPLVSPAGEKFMEAANLQIKDLERAGVDWILFGDDDRWFQPSAINAELPTALRNPNVDLWYATSYFVWDTPDKYNAAREHRSPIIWRHRKGDRFPPSAERIIQAPLPLHDDAIAQGRTGDLKSPLLDYGTFSAAERTRVQEVFRRAGKVDAYTESISQPPQLRPLNLAPGDDLFSERPADKS